MMGRRRNRQKMEEVVDPLSDVSTEPDVTPSDQIDDSMPDWLSGEQEPTNGGLEAGGIDDLLLSANPSTQRMALLAAITAEAADIVEDPTLWLQRLGSRLLKPGSKKGEMRISDILRIASKLSLTIARMWENGTFEAEQILPLIAEFIRYLRMDRTELVQES